MLCGPCGCTTSHTAPDATSPVLHTTRCSARQLIESGTRAHPPDRALPVDRASECNRTSRTGGQWQVLRAAKRGACSRLGVAPFVARGVITAVIYASLHFADGVGAAAFAVAPAAHLSRGTVGEQIVVARRLCWSPGLQAAAAADS
eukprot:353182-Chlamydomonas_euryale.AAC.20